MTLIDRPRMQVLAGGKDITDRCDSITFSATDRGGFEIATLGLPSADRPTKGTRVTIRQGLEVAWDGRVAEVADHSVHGRATKTTGCEGWQALLRDNPYREIYADRDLSRWQGPSLDVQKTLIAEGWLPQAASVAPDPTAGAPSVVTGFSGPWTLPGIPRGEAWYDTGGIAIGSIYYSWVKGSEAPTSWNWQLDLYDVAEHGASGDSSGNLAGAGPGTGTLSATTSTRKFAKALLFVSPSAAGGSSVAYAIYWQQLAVYGQHGLTKRGEEPGGFYPSDIARHALGKAAGVQPGVIIDSTGYIAPHVVYSTPTNPADVINDMAKLLGWTWGVWEPPSILSTEPRLDFRPPPTDATAAVTKAECDELDITSRLGDLYDTAIVTYTDAAGTAGQVTVRLASPQLYETGVHERTLELEGGLTSEEGAQVLGLFALGLSQIASRGAGQATLPLSVKLPNGASKPSCLLRPGIDRLRIVDLLDGGPMLEQGTSRRDVFRISRIETTVSKDGSPNTRVELDQGTNLLEVLQARLALEAGVVGSGAVG